MNFDHEKFSELLLYIADQSVDDPDFGATKLNKILFFSDFLAYSEFGAPVTGAVYQKLDHGPAPKPLLPIQAELIKEGAAQVVPVARARFTQKRLVALRAPKLDSFSADEVSLVDDIIAQLRGRTAVDVSRISHDWSLGWQVAKTGEEIPYMTAFWQAPSEQSAAVVRAEELSTELDLVS